MSIGLLVDMNLSPRWVSYLLGNGYHAVHWSTVGNPRATDRELMNWAVENALVVLTHDLDFGDILAVTGAAGPSVIQVRTQDVSPDSAGPIVVAALRDFGLLLASGALVIVNPRRQRARVLPLRRYRAEI